jgi:hypothetical protein
MFFAVVIFIGKPNQELAVKSVDDADVLFSDEDPDFYAELDFYVWLTEQDENAG